jgi:peptidylprolyl isomerase
MRTKSFLSKPAFKGFFFLMLLSLILIPSCKMKSRVAQPQFRSHESGIEYMIKTKGSGDKPAINDIVKVHYTLMLSDSTVIDSSFERGEPVFFKLGAGQVIKGWDIAMALLNEGDEAILIIPPDLAYGDQPMGDIPANSTLLFNVSIVDIIPAPRPFELDRGVTVTETDQGLKYAVLERGRGSKLQPGMRVKVHYSGFFEDLTLFDSSREREQPIDFVLGRGMVIKGWDEGLLNLSVGDRARLWVPYHMAYGEQGRGPIPPAANLIFDIEILDAAEPVKATPFNVAGKDTLQAANGLKYIIMSRGEGNNAQAGDVVSVHYTGYLTDGTKFDSSVERGQPFRFVLGQGQVIPGWDQGIVLMSPKARYRFIIPPALAYGNRGAGPIPANATLIFDVELLGIEQ